MIGNAPFQHGSSGHAGAGDQVGGPVQGACADTPPILDQRFDADSLYALRAAVEAHTAQAGMPHGRTDDIVIAVHELAANAVRHGAGAGRLRIWKTEGELRCQVDDDGPPAPSGAPRHGVQDADQGGAGEEAGRNPADLWPYRHGHGLWLVRQTADRMDLHAGPQGTRATITFALPPRRRPPFGLTRRAHGGCVILDVRGDLDRQSAHALTDGITELITSGPAPLRLVLDLSGLTFWDSSGLAALVTVQRKIDGSPPAAMVVAAPPGSIRRRLRDGGLIDRITFTDTTDQAVRELAPDAPD